MTHADKFLVYFGFALMVLVIMLGGLKKQSTTLQIQNQYHRIQAPPPPNRFVMMANEDPDHNHRVEVWEDKTTRQEIICIYNRLAVPSCYLSGQYFSVK